MSRSTDFDVAVVGSGFAGSILARTLRRLGLEVALFEKQRHPRFALGESSTPLANFCLERLARRYELPDLHQLAAYGRWLAAFPELQRGLKRGFTFYFHRPGEAFSAGEANRNRLLVAASPEDALADSHWLRADVDAFLAARAVEEGVVLREGSPVVSIVPAPDGYELTLRPLGAAPGERTRARFVVDATGPSGSVAEALGAGRVLPAARFHSRLVFAHFSGLAPFAQADGLEPGPYPDERAAVHHLLEEGWIYVLPFDDGRVSAGLVLIDERRGAAGADANADPEVTWRRVLARYPSLEASFAGARLERPLVGIDPLQHRRRRSAGGSGDGRRAWAVLPHAFAFFDPMFSTGMAWSLLGVERLAAVFSTLADDPAGGELDRRLAVYDRGLAREADQIERLILGAYRARRDPELFAAQSFLYFAVVSHEELGLRLLEEEASASVAGRGFLGAGEPGLESLFEEAATRLAGIRRADGAARRALSAGFESWIRRSIAPLDLLGLAEPARRNLYPVDLDIVRDRAGLLGLSRAQLEKRLDRLRGGGEEPEAVPGVATDEG